jgi:hypothetical protein
VAGSGFGSGLVWLKTSPGNANAIRQVAVSKRDVLRLDIGSTSVAEQSNAP